MSHLCITLGHNSSAILISKNKIICGYENERLSKIKSDSQFPLLAIEKCLEITSSEDVSDVYISHWSTNGVLSDLALRYYDPYYLATAFPTARFHSLTKDFTHHDAHYYSAKCFAGGYDEDFAIVADGFGNFGETISIYHKGQVIERVFGYQTSLGLLYQYATAYLGLKMHQDEYKLLGYEAHINFATDRQIAFVNRLAISIIKGIRKDIDELIPTSKYDPLYNVSSLPQIRADYEKRYDKLLAEFEEEFQTSLTPELKKIIISYIAQSVVENIILYMVTKYKMKRVLLSGGVFLNVKLNNEISKHVDEISVMPLSGDQGAALGIYHYLNPGLEINNLFWGNRVLDGEKLDADIIVIDEGEITGVLVEALNEDNIVNLIHGGMEFGPRALGNTSTLAIPTEENRKYINMVNGRSDIMPMAPVINDFDRFFVNKRSTVYKSLAYMVVAQNYKPNVEDIKAVSHPYYKTGIFTGRPQVIEKGHHLYTTVEEFGILINTSFNIHGVPIVYDEVDINEAHEFQKARDYDGKIITIVVLP